MVRRFSVAILLLVFAVADLHAGTEEGGDASERLFLTEGVRRIYLAAQLADISREQSDPLHLLAAARLKAWAGGRKHDFRPQIGSGVAYEKHPGLPPRSFEFSPEGMLGAARIEAAGNRYLLALVEATAVETNRLAKQRDNDGPRFQKIALPPGGRATVLIKYYRGIAATAVVGSWVTKLDLIVRDGTGKTICEERGWTDHKFCSWPVDRAADYELIIENPGARTDEFLFYVN